MDLILHCEEHKRIVSKIDTWAGIFYNFISREAVEKITAKMGNTNHP